MGKRIYLADDEENIRVLMTTFLANAGYEVTPFSDGDSLLAAYRDNRPDLVILDVMMPGTDGLTLCSLLREQDPNLPLIIVSARDDPYDRVTGLSMGSDDYLIKPFLPLELVARVKALFRRSETESSRPADEVISYGRLVLDERTRTATLSGNALTLTPTEFGFLSYLIRKRDRAVSREELLKELWGFSQDADTRATDDLVKRLRRKLKDAHANFEIETIWGFGFRLVKGV